MKNFITMIWRPTVAQSEMRKARLRRISEKEAASVKAEQGDSDWVELFDRDEIDHRDIERNPNRSDHKIDSSDAKKLSRSIPN